MAKNPLQFLKPTSLIELNHKLAHFIHGRLWMKVLLGMFLGIFIGIVLGPDAGLVSKETGIIISEWLALPGTIFINIIQMIVIPLIIASIINGIASSESVKQLKKTGISIIIYFIITTTVAILIGICLTSIINPGNYIDKDLLTQTKGMQPDVDKDSFTVPSAEEIPQQIGTMLPTNIFGSLLNGDMLKIVIFSIILGIALINLKPKNSKPLLNLLDSIQQVSMTIVKWALTLAPIAVFGLMTKLTSRFGINLLAGLGIYVLTVIAGLILLIIFYMIIVYISSKKKPITFLKEIKEVQLLAFSTSSSAAVMPVTMKTAQENLKIKKSVYEFLIPIGTTINMDGTALYQAVATIFLAQVFGVELGLISILLIIVTIVGASIGSPGTPGVGMAILAVVLTSVGIPAAGLALIIGVDRLLDMSRTATNVTGDLTACVFMNKFLNIDKKRKKV
ncbi:dicarboxylate/amino acid:cation symporter [Candidatus Woesearchaeota archaeon]|nr:dicarboxylate/amino acid:cation symporter [Candidatus Woesearchaeota archaeon]MCF7900634.1 dicarboxylate/amino acid:cation symporter [Candidatus Woesearchaeota archaeon]MCF8013474.1 dicarboxylate/amino acid:cation symporter [Candidatus Woesearchaeota archaeon]